MTLAADARAPLWAYALLTAVAAFLTFAHAPAGVALSMDSLYYLSTAAHIAAGHGIANDTYALSGSAIMPTTIWPPLYAAGVAAITALGKSAGVSDVASIAIFNGLALTTTAWLVMRLATEASSWTVGLVVAFALLMAPSVQLVHTYAWSEVLFIPLTLAGYGFLQTYLSSSGEPRSTRPLWYFVAIFALASYTRYVGIAFFAAALLALLVYDRGGLAWRIRRVVAAGAVFAVLLAPLLVRNVVVSGAMSGTDRGTPDTSIVSDASTLLWFLYLELLNVPVAIGATLLGVSVAAATWLLLRRDNNSAQPVFAGARIGVPLLIVSVYFTFLLISRSLQMIDLDTRMISVALPFILLALAGLFGGLVMRIGIARAALPFVLPLLAYGANALSTHGRIIDGWREQGEPGTVLTVTYPSITGKRFDTLRSIRDHFSPQTGELILTDVSRPIIVDYLFGDAEVRRLPDTVDADAIQAVESLLDRPGLMLIGGAAWSDVLTQRLDGRADIFTVSNESGATEWLVVTLPVTSP